MMWLSMERRSRRSTDTYILGRWWLRIMTRYKKWKGESDRDGVHSASWTISYKIKMCQWDWRGNQSMNANSQWGLVRTTSNTQLEKLVTTQRKMEIIIVGVTLKDRKSTNWIRKQSYVTDTIRNIRESKHRWAGMHGEGTRDNRWTVSHRMDTPWL